MLYARDTALIATPVGMVSIEGDDTHITSIAIRSDRSPARRADAPAVIAAAEQLEAWFAGELKRFDLQLAPPKTARGAELRDGLIAIGYGQTISYGGLARQLGSSARAIGQLCARNPYPIVVPCHRVVASDGLGHYSAGGGVTTKNWLLAHEIKYGEQQ